MIKFNLPKFVTYPYIKSSLDQCNFPEIGANFKKSYDNLPSDPYLMNKTRQRRYANYHITNKDNKDFTIEITNKNEVMHSLRQRPKS